MALVDNDGNIFGFKISDITLINAGVNAGQGGYATVELKSRLKNSGGNGSANGRTGWLRRPETAMPGLGQGNPIEQGVINIRYDKDSHFFDVFWAAGNTHYIETDNRHTLALVDADGILCGFRIIDTDQLGDGKRDTSMLICSA